MTDLDGTAGRRCAAHPGAGPAAREGSHDGGAGRAARRARHGRPEPGASRGRDFVIEAVFEAGQAPAGAVGARGNPCRQGGRDPRRDASSLCRRGHRPDLRRPSGSSASTCFQSGGGRPAAEIIAGKRPTTPPWPPRSTSPPAATDRGAGVAEAPELRGQPRAHPHVRRDQPRHRCRGDPQAIDHALDPMGLPMTPLQLLDFISTAVLVRIASTMNDAYPDQFTLSPWLEHHGEDAALENALPTRGETSDLPLRGCRRGPRARPPDSSIAASPVTADGELLARVQDALADEIGPHVDKSVVATTPGRRPLHDPGGRSRCTSAASPYLNRAAPPASGRPVRRRPAVALSKLESP
ncbi:3-hydroxyacyl-CoA dehydrogenase family protein [Kocuria rhizophila]|nr:3-hydroxyacyl-CoA dehydrogenase family protein [Kocuria rhizophila]